MKWIVRGLIAIVLIVVVAGVVAFLFIDSIAKAGVEKATTYATGVQTTLGSIHVGLFSGEVSLSELDLANPDGFKGEYFLTLGQGDVDVSLGTLMGDQIVVPLINLDTIRLNLQQNEEGQYNYQAIMDHMAKLKSPDTAQKSESTKTYIVNKILITDVRVDTTFAGQDIKVNIPKIELTDIGSNTSNGVVLSQLNGVILQAIFRAVVENAGDVLPGVMLSGLNEGLGHIGNITDFGAETIGDVTGQVGDVVKQLGVPGADKVGETVDQALKEGGQTVDEGINKLGEGIGNLLGGDKKEEDK